MDIQAAKYGSYLVIILRVYNPSSDAAEDPSVAAANLYTVAGGVLTLLASVNLAQIGVIPGIWGGAYNLGATDMSNSVVIAQVTVGGVDRSTAKLLGSAGSVSTVMTIGAPQITVTPGPVDVQGAKNAAP